MIHPFDLFKIADDWTPLSKAAGEHTAPKYEGEKHPTKPLVGIAHWKVSSKGKQSPHAYDQKGKEQLVWQGNSQVRKDHDAKLARFHEKPEIYSPSQSPEDLALFKGFMAHVKDHPGRHSRKSFPGESTPCARHLIGAIEKPELGHQFHFFTTKKGKRMMAFQAVRHGEGGVPYDHHKAERWVFDGQKVGKTPAVPDEVFHRHSKAPDLKEFFGPDFS